MVCEDLYLSNSFRSALYYVLFDKLEVPGIVSAFALVTPLYLTGAQTGVICR